MSPRSPSFYSLQTGYALTQNIAYAPAYGIYNPANFGTMWSSMFSIVLSVLHSSFSSHALVTQSSFVCLRISRALKERESGDRRSSWIIILAPVRYGRSRFYLTEGLGHHVCIYRHPMLKRQLPVRQLIVNWQHAEPWLKHGANWRIKLFIAKFIVLCLPSLNEHSSVIES